MHGTVICNTVISVQSYRPLTKRQINNIWTKTTTNLHVLVIIVVVTIFTLRRKCIICN